MRGRRIADGQFHDASREPGDYGLCGRGLWLVLPTGRHARLNIERWTWTEEIDGTLTVSPSIFDTPAGWHGYLERGQWRSV